MEGLEPTRRRREVFFFQRLETLFSTRINYFQTEKKLGSQNDFSRRNQLDLPIFDMKYDLDLALTQ